MAGSLHVGFPASQLLMPARLYHAWGLSIASFAELPLPPADPADAAKSADVWVTAAAIIPPEPIPSLTGYLIDGDSIYLQRPGIGRFEIRAGSDVIAELDPGYSDLDVASFVVGAALGVILHQRGLLVLHACAVELGGRVVAFAGGSGAGKSTIALALLARGARLVTDDVLALRVGRDSVLAIPGAPIQKLWPDSLHFRGLDPQDMPRVSPSFDKRIHVVEPTEKDLPLTNVLVLDWGEAIDLSRLSASQAFPEIVRHSFCSLLLDSSTTTAHFRQCADLTRGTRVDRLTRPREMTALAPTIDRVLQAFS